MNNTIKLETAGNKIKKLAKNLRYLLQTRRITESEIAQSLNIPVMTVRRLVSGETTDPRISTLKLFADYFNVSVDTLIEDNDDKPILHIQKTIPQFVPILDWEKITTITSIRDIDLKTWSQWHPIVFGEHGSLNPHAFALESRPSMQPRFPIGTLFIIDPDETPDDGDMVLIKVKADGNVTLRQIIIDMPRWQLQPVIPGSDILFYDDMLHQIMGIVVMTFLHCRK